MLYVYHGTDTGRVADRTNALIAGLRGKRAGAQVFMFEGDDFEDSEVDALIDARGLFVEKHIVVFKQPFVKSDSTDRLLSRVERFGLSENIFIIEEGKLDTHAQKVLEKHAEKIEKHGGTQTKDEFNVFALGDALGARKQKELWLLYMQAQRAGVATAPLVGTLHWAARSMLLAARCNTAEESGQKPYVFSKFKRYASNYTMSELHTLSRSLLTMYHDARRGTLDLDRALECFILSL